VQNILDTLSEREVVVVDMDARIPWDLSNRQTVRMVRGSSFRMWVPCSISIVGCSRKLPCWYIIVPSEPARIEVGSIVECFQCNLEIGCPKSCQLDALSDERLNSLLWPVLSSIHHNSLFVPCCPYLSVIGAILLNDHTLQSNNELFVFQIGFTRNGEYPSGGWC